MCLMAEFDSWYEESFLRGPPGADAPAAGSTSSVTANAAAAAGKRESLDKDDTCVRYVTSECGIRLETIVN